MRPPAIDPSLSPPGQHFRPQSHPHGGERSAATGTPQAGNGFTLVELLVVIALIAILAGLLFPVLGAMRERVYLSTCLSNLRQISQAHLLYMQDWDERFPDWRMPTRPRPAPYGELSFWTEYFQPYLHSAAILRDPGATWQGPPLADGGVRLADYALMTWGPGGRWDREAPHFRWAGPPLSLAQVVRPTETIDWMDGWTTTSQMYGWGIRHREGLNVGFVDGHVRWLTGGELWRTDSNERGAYWLHYGTADR